MLPDLRHKPPPGSCASPSEPLWFAVRRHATADCAENAPSRCCWCAPEGRCRFRCLRQGEEGSTRELSRGRPSAVRATRFSWQAWDAFASIRLWAPLPLNKSVHRGPGGMSTGWLERIADGRFRGHGIHGAGAAGSGRRRGGDQCRKLRLVSARAAPRSLQANKSRAAALSCPARPALLLGPSKRSSWR